MRGADKQGGDSRIKDTTVAGGSYLIDPAGHKAAQKTEKIHKKASGGAGSEKEWLKKTGPQLPQV